MSERLIKIYYSDDGASYFEDLDPYKGLKNQI